MLAKYKLEKISLYLNSLMVDLQSGKFGRGHWRNFAQVKLHFK